MMPQIIDILRETSSNNDIPTPNQKVITSLIEYLDTNLIFLKSNLVKENFDRVLSVVWSATSSAMLAIINEAISTCIK